MACTESTLFVRLRASFLVFFLLYILLPLCALRALSKTGGFCFVRVLARGETRQRPPLATSSPSRSRPPCGRRCRRRRSRGRRPFLRGRATTRARACMRPSAAGARPATVRADPGRRALLRTTTSLLRLPSRGPWRAPAHDHLVATPPLPCSCGRRGPLLCRVVLRLSVLPVALRQLLLVLRRPPGAGRRLRCRRRHGRVPCVAL